MDTFDELIQAVQDDLTVGAESSLFDENIIKRAINRAYRKSGGLFRWPETEDSKTTTVQEDTEYIDYPQNWKPNSLWKLMVNGTDYKDPLVFKDYLYEKENDHPDGETNIWSNNWRRYFADPAFNQNDIVKIHGQKVVTALSADGDTTIFSYSMPEGNEAIVLEAKEILKAKGDVSKTEGMISPGALQLLSNAWNKIAAEMRKYEKTMPMLDVVDMFAPTRPGRKDSNIGRF